MQEVIVIIIGIIVFGYTGYKIYKTLTQKPNNNNNCGCGKKGCQ